MVHGRTLLNIDGWRATVACLLSLLTDRTRVDIFQ